jgi:hypothetical protein
MVIEILDKVNNISNGRQGYLRAAEPTPTGITHFHQIFPTLTTAQNAKVWKVHYSFTYLFAVFNLTSIRHADKFSFNCSRLYRSQRSVWRLAWQKRAGGKPF